MAQYLKSILKILPAVQAKQLTTLMNSLQIEGQVRNADEYQIKLKELAKLINDKNPKSSFQEIRSIVWHLITSEAHNMMMGSLKNDIEALFLQIDEISKTTDSHHYLLMKNLFADIERGLDDQENNIRRLEWLAGQNNEFSLALVNSFNSISLNRIARSAIGAETLYFDNRTYEKKTASELPNAVVSTYGQKLMLDVKNNSLIVPLSVSLFSDSASYGTEIFTSIDNPIENIIDNKIGTFWNRDVYLSEPVEEVTTVLQFDLGLSKDVDFIIIERAAEVPFFVKKIEGVLADGSLVSLLSAEREIISNTRLDFPKVFVKAIKVTFSTKSYTRAEYFTEQKESLHKVISIDSNLTELERSDALSPLSSEVLASKNLNELLNVPEQKTKQVYSYLYPFALDNIWFGNSLYKDSGVFVSSPLKGSNFGLVAVKSLEDLGTDNLNSIEYEIIKRDISPKYKEVKFPIPSLGQRTITNERLVLIKREDNSTITDTGMLRFCPLVRADSLTDAVIVYENGKRLQVGADYYYSISFESGHNNFLWNANYLYASDFNNFSLDIPKMWIKIRFPKSNSIYTVDYKIRTSNSNTQDQTVWMNKEKTLFLSDNNHILFNKENLDVTIDSEMYLQITLRRNSASQSVSPILKEYAILGATYNG